MKLPDWAWTGLSGVAVGGAIFFFVCQSQRRAERAADQATIAAQAVTIGDLQKRVIRLDTVYIQQTKDRIVTRQRWDTIATIVNRVDTLVHRDTLRLVVAVADSAIRACTVTVETCEQRTAALRQIVTADSGALRALSRELARAKIRNRLGCYAGGQLTASSVNPIEVRAGVGIGCGLRMF